MATDNTYKRLESLDMLRGLDLFLLVAFQPVFVQLAQALGEDSFLWNVSQTLFTHEEWFGFHLWDQIMPLFLFMAGTSIPFAFAKYREQPENHAKYYRRIVKRVVLLCIFGAIVQGNLLDLNIHTLYIYTDTLQSIAMGYLFSVLFFMFLPKRSLWILFLLLPAIYTVGMLINGSYAPGENLAEQIDRHILGRFVNGATVAADGSVVFADWYHYSWIYSTLNFTATVMSGLLTGCILKSDRTDRRKMQLLLFGGVGCLVLAFGLSFVEPIIKRIWTSSMTFLSSGISILLMLAFYYWIDVCKSGRGWKWLKIYGMNSILAYMLYETMNSTSLLTYWLHGLEQYVGNYYATVFELVHVLLILFILSACYKYKIYLKV